MSNDLLINIVNLASIATSISVIIAIPFAILQIREATRSRYLEALAKVFEEFRSDTFFEDRRFVYSHLAFNYRSCTQGDRDRVERLINTYNRMAFLVEKGLIPQRLILEIWSGAILASWQKLESYTRERRVDTGFSDWAIHFEHLATQSREYRVKVLKEIGSGYTVPISNQSTVSHPNENEEDSGR